MIYPTEVFAGLSGHCNSIYNIIPLLKKENIHLFSCPWGYNNYADAYFQSSWERAPGGVRVLYKEYGGARGVMVILAGNGHGETSSNPGRDWLHFT